MCSKWVKAKSCSKFKLMVIEYAEKMNCNAQRMFGIVGSKNMEMEETKTEADRYELHPKIFQWPQEWTFPSIRTVNC